MVIYMLDNNLKFCRESIEMTQKELGYVFGVAESTVSGWENNNDTIPLKKLVKFCKLFNFSIDFVIGLDRCNKGFKTEIICDKKLIGYNLKKFRKEKKLNQSDIANKLSISQTALSNYELGITLITTFSLYTFCKTFNLSMDDMLLKSD